MTPIIDLILLISSCVFVCFILTLLNIFHRQWWTPIRLQKLLGLNGIKGPSYSFIYGSTKEILAMQKQAMSKPWSFSDHNIFPRLQPHFHHWTKLYGKNFVQWDGSRAQLVVTEPDLVKDILMDRDEFYTKGQLKPFVLRLLGFGLVTSSGEKWAKIRKLANYAFHSESLKRMIPEMIESAEKMVEKWEAYKGKEIEVYKEFRCYTSEVISRTAFGSSYVEGKKIFDMVEKLALLASRNFYKQNFPLISKVFKTADEKESEWLDKEVRESIVELIRKREDRVVSGEEDGYGSDFLGLLLKAHCGGDGDEKQRISVNDIVDECKTFYFAGQETTNSLLSWTVFLLAVHVDWQEEARKEVLTLLGKQNPKPDDLAKLKIMGMIINETLRLYSPVVTMHREIKTETSLGDFDLPKNIQVVISSLAIHHDPEIWGRDAQLFKPERFSEGVAKATKNNIAAFMPFGMGTRTCVGFNFAISEAKVALAMILQRYTLGLSPAYVHSPVVLLTNRPQFGVQVLLQPL